MRGSNLFVVSCWYFLSLFFVKFSMYSFNYLPWVSAPEFSLGKLRVQGKTFSRDLLNGCLSVFSDTVKTTKKKIFLMLKNVINLLRLKFLFFNRSKANFRQYEIVG